MITASFEGTLTFSYIFTHSATDQPGGNMRRWFGNSVSLHADIRTLMKFCWRSMSSLGQHL